MRLRYYVAEVNCTGACAHAETWTLKAKSLPDAKRRIRLASGKDAHSIALIAETPARYWRAG